MLRLNPPRQITTQPVLPDANGYTWIFDSTDPRAWHPGHQYAKTAALPTVGPVRGGAMNQRVHLTASCADQNITLKLYTLDGAGAWKLYTPAVGEITITSGASPQGVEWSILAADILIGFLAGATPPSAIATTLYLVERWG
jgi:hypothetical protein